MYNTLQNVCRVRTCAGKKKRVCVPCSCILAYFRRAAHAFKYLYDDRFFIFVFVEPEHMPKEDVSHYFRKSKSSRALKKSATIVERNEEYIHDLSLYGAN